MSEAVEAAWWSSVWHRLRETPAHRLVEAPRIAEREAIAEAVASVDVAYQAGRGAGPGLLAVAWMRDGDGLVDIASLCPVGASSPIVWPAAARSVPLPAGELTDRLNGFGAWAEVEVRPVARPMGTGAAHAMPAPGRVSRTLESVLLARWSDPCAVLVVAEPASGAELDGAATELTDALWLAEHGDQVREDFADHARTERIRTRLGEIAQTDGLGWWRVRVLAGGRDADSVRTIATLAAGSFDLGGLPYQLSLGGDLGAGVSMKVRGLEQLLSGPRDQYDNQAVSTLAVARFVAPPTTEVPGIRLVEAPTFSVTPPALPSEVSATSPTMAAVGKPGLRVATVLDGQLRQAGGLTLPRESLVRHTFVCGATGAGKSQTVRGLLTEASAAGIPWLVVEPAKAEYRRMASRLRVDDRVHSDSPHSGVVVIRPGDAEHVAAGLNPLRPVPGFPLRTHIDLVRAMFLAAFTPDEPFPQVLTAALMRCYEQQGWVIPTGRPRYGHARYPTLTDLVRAAQEVTNEIGYGKEVTDNVRGFVKVRLASLQHGAAGAFLEPTHQLDMAQLLRENVVLELEDVGSDADKAIVMGTLLVALTEHLRLTHHADRYGDGVGEELRHLTVIEEAHRLLRADPAAGVARRTARYGVEALAALLAEVRAYGEGLIVAEQIPSKLIPDVIKNTAVKIVHRLPAADDRRTVGATMNLTDRQSAYLVTVPPGRGAVFVDGMDQPVLAQMPDGTAFEAHPPSVTGPDTIVALETSLVKSPLPIRDLTAARHALEDRPLVRAWVELHLLAHLTGNTGGRPSGQVLEQLAGFDAGFLPAALAQAIDAAVAERSTVLHRFLNPASFANHLHATLLESFDGATRAGRAPACASPEPEWVAAPWRWDVPRIHLILATRKDPNARPHRLTQLWEQQTGQRLAGDTVGAQLDQVKQFTAELRDYEVEKMLTFGSGRPCLWEQLTNHTHDDPAFTRQLKSILGKLTDRTWPDFYLTVFTPGDPKQPGDNGQESSRDGQAAPPATGSASSASV